MAHSSGGPYALACALALPERVSSVVLASCVAPLDELTPDLVGVADDEQHLVELSRSDPESAAAMIADSASWLLDEPDRLLAVPRPEPDARLLQEPPVRQMFAASVREAVRRGLDGYISDALLERRPSGYRLGDVMLPVAVWHGAQDGYIPQVDLRPDRRKGRGRRLPRQPAPHRPRPHDRGAKRRRRTHPDVLLTRTRPKHHAADRSTDSGAITVKVSGLAAAVQHPLLPLVDGGCREEHPGPRDRRRPRRWATPPSRPGTVAP